MSRSILVRVTLGVLLGAAAVYAVQQLFPSEERRIRRQLEAIADDANHLSADLAGAATAARLSRYFTEDVTIDPGGGVEPVRGRQTILALARSMHVGAETRVAVKDEDVQVAPEGASAKVTLTVMVTRDAGTSNETVEASQLALTMVKRESEWLISHVTGIDTVR